MKQHQLQLLCFAACALMLSGAAPLRAASTTRVSISDSEAQSNNTSRGPSMSGDGRFVGFTSFANNLVSGDTNDLEDAFVRDRKSGTTQRLNVLPTGAQSSSGAGAVNISADGRYAIFGSSDPNLAADNTSGAGGSYRRDLQTGTTQLLVSRAGVGGISADGRYVVFGQLGSDSVNRAEVFRLDLETGLKTRVSLTPTNTNFPERSHSYLNSNSTAISRDGRFVVFYNYAFASAGEPADKINVYVRDVPNNRTMLVSATPQGVKGNKRSEGGGLSADGRYVIFSSESSDLVANDTNNRYDVFRRDLQTQTTQLLSVARDGAPSNGDSFAGDLSADGRYVVFNSYAGNLINGDTNGGDDVFVRDVQNNTTTRVNVSTRGVESPPRPFFGAFGGLDYYEPRISRDGRYVSFASYARNLVAGDTNGDAEGFGGVDIFVRDRLGDGFVLTPPQTGSITPPSAINAANQARTFTATYSDADGVDDIALVGFRIGGSGQNSANALVCAYDAVTDKLSIYNDAATARIGSVTPGTATVLSNSQGSLNCKDVTVSKSGNTLTVNWNVSATGAFAGTKQPTFLFVRDASGLSDGYDGAGTWTISGNGRPSTVSVDPASVADTSGVERVFTTVFSDPNGFKNLSFVTLRLGGSGTNSAGAMVCVYNVQNGKLYLFDDKGNYNARQANFPGRAAVLSNSQGSLDCARTTVTGAGNTLTVKWSVKARASFSGSHAIALLCADRANLRDGYDTYGTWMITGVSDAAAPSGLSTAKAASNTVTLVFAGAAPQSGYTVIVNGAPAQVTSTNVQGGKVGLQLAEPLQSGDKVIVTWPGGSTSLVAS